MRKSLIFTLSIILIASLVLAGCATPTPEAVVETEEAAPASAEIIYERAETLYVSGAAWGPPSTWNPYQPGNLANTTGTIGYLYETLFNFDPMTGEFIPWLAESGDWTDDTTFDVTLREGLTWSDGEALTAADVVYSFELGKTYEALWFSPLWTNTGLTSITADGDLKLQFKFSDPLYQEWGNYLYNLPIVPQHIWSEKTEEAITTGANENPVGSGAYLYETHSEDRNVWLRNENWWGVDIFGLPKPKRIVDIRTSSNNIAMGMVLKGELDLSNNFLPGIAEMSSKGYVTTYFDAAPYMLSANTAVLFLNTTKKPMDDAAFRKALAFSINVDDIVNVAYANLVKAASPTGLLPTMEQFVDQEVVDSLGYYYDPEEAASILADAGYVDVDGDGFVEAPDGSAIALEVTCPIEWTDWMEAINVIATSAQEAGINLTAVTPDYGAWNTALTTGTFDMTLNNWANMSNTPWTLYNLLFRHPIQESMQSGNFGRYVNQEIFDLVDALAKVQVTDIEGMKAACSAIQEAMLTEVPMISLWYNGLWSQYSNSVWTNWPTEHSTAPTLPTTWSGYWQMGGLQTLINLELVQP